MFKGIDRVEIVTAQLDRTVQFYTEVLGFTVRARRCVNDGRVIPCSAAERSHGPDGRRGPSAPSLRRHAG